MKKFMFIFLASAFAGFVSSAKEVLPSSGSLAVREIHYSAKLANDEARLALDIAAEATGTGESSVPLLEGDVAVLPGKLCSQLKIVREGHRYWLVATHPGHFKFTLNIVAKIQHAEPWNQISFTGPAATIASLTAQAAGTNTEVQLLAGTLLQTFKTNGVSGVEGVLGSEQNVALRWQGKVTEVARQALFTVDSTITAQVTPTVIQYTSKFHYDIVQGNAPQLLFRLPVNQTLTKLEGEQIRDWHITTESGHQTLVIEFIKPLENGYDLTLHAEQPAKIGAPSSALNPPQPLNTERESGSLTVYAEDTLVEVATLNGLRQVNAPDKAVVSYRFNARAFTLALTLKPIEPLVRVADRVNARLEETRLLISHHLVLNVEKAGIYTLDLTPPSGFAVAEVKGEGVDDWKTSGGKLTVSFSARVLGSRHLQVQLEKALKTFPKKILVAPLRVAGAANETAQVGVASAPGIRLKTSELSGLREIPINQLPDRGDDILAYTAEQPDWQVSIASERLAARVVADVFNLVTIGDGVAGGSATIRYGLVNQGVQEFRVRVPASFKNVEFTGPNIRRKERSGEVWTIGLQDKVWGGYTLVVTYDYPFDAKGASLPMGGIHAVEVERETGSIAVTTAASLQLSPKISGDNLHRVDETELPAADRSLVTRAVILAYQYTGDQYDLNVAVQRFAEEPVLEAVADRTQITSVLTESGEMLTQASFMVKNNEKQFQRFQLPHDAKLWGCYVNGQPAKPERDNDWVLVSLPRGLNRDQAFAVDIMYAQTNGALTSTFGKTLNLSAPRTDVPNTYAEWQLFVPPTLRLSAFGGTMNVTEGTTYGLFDAWGKFLKFYGQVLHEMGAKIFVLLFLALLVFGLVIFAVKRGAGGVIELLVIVAILAILGAMMLPALSAAKRKAQTISSVNNLKQIGIAARIFSGDNNDRLPNSFADMSNELGTDRVTIDPVTGQRYTYLGGGWSSDELTPDSVLAYSPIVNGRCDVLFADGSVETMSGSKFGELSQRGLVQTVKQQQLAEHQREVIARGQLAVGRPVAEPVRTPGTQPAMRLEAGAAQSIGGSGLALGTAASGATPTVNGLPPMTPSAPVAAGIRSIRIDLPQTGTPFTFTKVLNVHGEPLSIRARTIPLHTFQTIQMLWQSAAFLLGLGVWWIQWRREHRNSFVLTLALALIIGSVCSLLIQWRALHDALIVGFPVVIVAIIALLVWKYWPRGRKPEAAETPANKPVEPDSALPPVLTSIVLAICLMGHSTFAATPQTPQSQAAKPSIVYAGYSGTINDRVAELQAILQFSGVSKGDVVPLFGADVAVQDFNVERGRAELIRAGSELAVRFGSRDDVTVRVKMLVKVTGDVTKRQLRFKIPAALSSHAEFTLAETGADVDFPQAISCRRITERNQTRVEAVIGAAGHIKLLWTPRVKRAEEVAATVFCHDAALASFAGGVMNVRSVLDYQITQGELRQVRVQLPAGQKLLRVEGSDIRTWEVKPGSASILPASGKLKSTNSPAGMPALPGGQILVVDLIKGVPLGWKLTLETEKVLDALPADVAVELPSALNVKRENGLVALSSSEELGLSVVSSVGLERMDTEEFMRATMWDRTSLTSAFRFADPQFTLRVHAEPFHPEIIALVKNNFRIGTEQVLLASHVDYTIKRAGVFSLKLALPEGYRVERVDGPNIQQPAERTEDGRRVLEITLKDRVLGAYSLEMKLARNFKQLPGKISVVGVHPLGVAKLTGYVAVSSEPGVAVKTEAFDGLTEIPAVSLPDRVPNAGSVLAYKFISPEPKATPEWKLTVAAENVSAWVRAEIVNTFNFTETLINGRALVRCEIANAPVKELRVRVPAELKNVEISGPNIRSRERDGNVWRVELQSPTQGFYTLAVTWDEPRKASAQPTKLSGIALEGAERESGLLAISAKSPLQVSESAATDLQRVDLADYPDWAGTPDSAATLIYHYVRPGYQLALNVRRFDDAAVLEALVDSAKFTSVVAADGQMMTEMSLSVRNNGRQFLQVVLPPGAKVWSAFVAGQAVRPSLRDSKVLLPIEATGDGANSLAVELTYVGTNLFPRTKGEVGFVSPKFDVPLKNARWEMYLPPDYDYQDFQGTMTHQTAKEPEPLSSSFSSLDYSRMEQAGKESAKVELQRDVSEARRQLAGGNVRVATESYNRAKAKFPAGKDADAAVKKLESDLKMAQASNLINAQNEFTVRNSDWAAGVSTQPQQKAGVALNYDNAAAQQQWMKLQQAQEIVTARVQPLHVNLPVRGRHLVFTQVLQTEGGRPMTIQFLAASVKAVNWPSRLGIGLGAFLVLWVIVAFVSRVTRNVVQPASRP